MRPNLIRRAFASTVDYLGISHFTPELRFLRDQIRKFSTEKVSSIAVQTDKTDKFPLHLWKEMGDMGILGITCPGFSIFL